MSTSSRDGANAAPPPLNHLRVLSTNLINRLHMLLNGIAITAILFYRFTGAGIKMIERETPLFGVPLPYMIITISEVILAFLWVLHQAYRWRPVKRTVFPERLPAAEEALPGVDVFVCTADPGKEPALGVMNTVISAMSLDYPGNKLAVYISDDGGCDGTLNAVREAWKFSRFWVPFCRKYKLKVRCPEVYFSTAVAQGGEDDSNEFHTHRRIVKERYGEFEEALAKNTSKSVSRDHPPTIQVMNDGSNKDNEMPLLVYVSREKRPGQPHHFKGGALNVLLRVSAAISNAPYFLVLDCDMYCYDPSSVRQAMCFYLDPKISQQLAWVQFPQKFRNTSEYDIYDGRLNPIWREGQGFDGIRGPPIYGCNFFMTREAIYGTRNISKGADLNQLKKLFGSSNEMIESINNIHTQKLLEKGTKPYDALQKELQLLASCAYDSGTQWGKEVGYRYFTVVEDSITGLELHCSGWKSVLLDPSKPCFLGTSTTNLNDMLAQQTRWSFGLMQIGLSRFMPLVYGPLRMSIIQSMCYGALVLDCLYTIPFYGLAILPPICMLYGIPLYPKVSNPFFYAFAYAFLSSQLKHVQEVFAYGDPHPFRNALYELRAWMMKSGGCYFYALINSIFNKVGLHKANFSLTNKADDDEHVKFYEAGIYDFRTSPMFLVPLCSIYILNMACFFIGIARRTFQADYESLLAQAVLSFFGIVVNYHLLEGMLWRKDNGCISPHVSQLALIISGTIFSCGTLIVKY
ncbi:unnamed protein product [Cuscuta europaea]|uniref:Cellulose synthase (UDP-forming) n=1 Tax=Cuscuta europaea TaxID=41803 RepID=A0A9P0YY91_CUSEU|nr:unnamed protein product [Cuscuta europaea]